MARLFLVGVAALVCSLAAAQEREVTKEEAALIDKYIANYEKEFSQLEAHTEASAKELRALVETTPFMVTPEITYRSKAPKSLKKKLLKRVAEKSYKTEKDIRDDIADIIGVRVTTFVPKQDLELVEGMLNKTLQMTEWRRGDPNGEYPGNNYRAMHKGYTVEIQTRGAFDHAFLQVQHKTLYKPKPGYELNADQKKMLEDLRGSVKAANGHLAKLAASIKATNHRFAEVDTDVDADADAESWITLNSASTEELFSFMSAYTDAETHVEEAAGRYRAARRAANKLRNNLHL